MEPIRSPMRMASAASEFAETMALIGSTPASRTRSMNSSTLRPCERVRAEDNFESRNLDRAANDIVIERQGPLHRRETLLGVAGRAEEALFIRHVILDHESGLRIEVCAVLS